MAASERRERVRRQVRADILQSAKRIARDEGWGAVTMRRIADEIEYTVPILYQYFENKDQLLETIRIEGFAFLNEKFLELKKLYRDPQKLIIEIAQVQWNFASENPEIYQVMFNLDGALCLSKNVFTTDIDVQHKHPVWEAIAMIRPRAADLVSRTFYEWWCLTYGFLAVSIVSQSRPQFVKTESIFMDAIRRFVKGLA
jgi:AcrR family transcriptional regulator